MHTVSQLEKQQIGLRLPKYLVEEIDEFTKRYDVNRTDIITEAVKSYMEEEKARQFYASFDQSCKEVKAMMEGKLPETTLGALIDELAADSDA